MSDPTQVLSALDATIKELRIVIQRHPIEQRSDREPLPWWMRKAIHARDGQRCRACDRKYGSRGRLVLDHIVPRSSFPVDQLAQADRSTNLLSLCWDCNAAKSNFRWPVLRVLGVTASCVLCEPIIRWLCEEVPPVAVWCAKCGESHVDTADRIA